MTTPGWSPVEGVEARTDENGTTFQFRLGDQVVRVRRRDDGRIGLVLRERRYMLARMYQPASEGRGTAVDLVPIEYVEADDDGDAEVGR